MDKNKHERLSKTILMVWGWAWGVLVGMGMGLNINKPELLPIEIGLGVIPLLIMWAVDRWGGL